MGHASITTTLDLYGHLYPGDMDRYADRLDTAADEGNKAKISPNTTSKTAARKVSVPDVGLHGRARRDSKPQPSDPELPVSRSASSGSVHNLA